MIAIRKHSPHFDTPTIQAMRELNVGSGSGMHEVGSIDNGPKEVAFLLKEDSDDIQAMKSPFQIECRMGVCRLRVLSGHAVYPIVILFRINAVLTYETWINVVPNPKVLPLLARQPRVAMAFVGDKYTIERWVDSPNYMQDFAEYAMEITRNARWEMHEFDEARMQCELNYPSHLELWQALEKKKTRG